MTCIKHLIRVKRSEGFLDYHVLEIEKGNDIFNHKKYNLKVESANYEDRCIHKGYYCVFELSKSGLILKDLYANQDKIDHIRLNNIKAINNENRPTQRVPERVFNTIYKNVNIDCSDFSGTMILGKVVKDGPPDMILLDTGEDFWRKQYGRLFKLTYKNRDIADLKEY